MPNSLDKFNAQIREWADKQPAKYRKSLKAIGYRCDKDTLAVTGTLEWMVKHARRNGYGVSLRTLKSHLKDFEACGLVQVARHRSGERQAASTYTVDLSVDIRPVKCRKHPWATPAMPGKCKLCQPGKPESSTW